MDLVLIIGLFILGTIFGSFYNVVGYRVPKGESILYPSSHCPKCNHELKAYELIPVLSFIFLGGKCKNCKSKISFFYPVFELLTGLGFAASYMVFGLSLDCLYSIVFISMLIIIVISDYQTMLIPDSVLIFGSLLLIFIKFFMTGIESIGISLLHALAAFIFMLLIKLLGDFMFKKESMGGGDIKLLAVFGFVLGFPLSIISIFLSAIIGLPVSLILLKAKKGTEIPFGPFLSIAAIIIFLSQVDFSEIIKFLAWS